MKTQKYQVRDGDRWITCKKAAETGKHGFLHYELSDGTNGLAKAGDWRKKPEK